MSVPHHRIYSIIQLDIEAHVDGWHDVGSGIDEMTVADSQPYLAFKSFLANRYGQSLYRIPIDLDFGCPNRDKDGSGGCTFCSLDGSRAVQTTDQLTIHDQVKKAMAFARDRYNAQAFIAYFQAYTATFAPLSQQRYFYESVLENYDFKAVSIGTRPDCLSNTVIKYLSDLNKSIGVWIELGIQTIHDQTLEKINRGHDWASSEKAIYRLHEAGIPVAAHVILGLPGETSDHYKQTADKLAQLPIDAVKIHNLHIIKNTVMEQQYASGEISVLHPFEYGNHVIDFIRRTPRGRPMMRVTTDTSKEQLIAPQWQISKGQFMTWLHQQMSDRGVKQGDLCGKTRDVNSQYNETSAPARNLMLGVYHTNLLNLSGIAEQGITQWHVLASDKANIHLMTEYSPKLAISSILDDPRWSIRNLPEQSVDWLVWNTNAIAYDATLMSQDFLERAMDLLSPHGKALLCTRDQAVVTSLQKLGFCVYETKIGDWFSIIASKCDNLDLKVIATSNQSNGSKLIPYRDPDLCWPHTQIIRDREQRILRKKRELSSPKLA